MKKLVVVASLFASMVLLFNFASAQTSISFPDVKPTDWFYGDVMKMVEWDVIRGNGDGTFKPANNVNRAELSAMWNRYDKKIQNQFTYTTFMAAYTDATDVIDDLRSAIYEAPASHCNTTNEIYKEMLLPLGLMEFTPEKSQRMQNKIQRAYDAIASLEQYCSVQGYNVVMIP